MGGGLKLRMSSLAGEQSNVQSAAKRMKAKICLVGEPAVGKTSLIRRFVLDVFDDSYVATMGAKVMKRDVGVVDDNYGSLLVNLVIWDIMGDKSFRDLFKEAFFQGAQGLIAVCDVTRKYTLSELKNWVDDVTRIAGSIPVVVLANKIDLVSESEISEEEIKRYCTASNSDYIMTSAKTGENVEPAFDTIAKNIISWRVNATNAGLV